MQIKKIVITATISLATLLGPATAIAYADTPWDGPTPTTDTPWDQPTPTNDTPWDGPTPTNDDTPWD
ncbi:hypothetical protein ABGB14_11425 [Nonomuraea sp. B10E15]|uniref:hypothetical protein n=1 Tax=Nonomuraea sp. B10E15 TaxID=3153560 RepID=UPI00325F67F6